MEKGLDQNLDYFDVQGGRLVTNITKLNDDLAEATKESEKSEDDGGLSSIAEFRVALGNARDALNDNLKTPLQQALATGLTPFTQWFSDFVSPEGGGTVFHDALKELQTFLKDDVTPKIREFFEAFADDPKQALKDAYSGIVDAIADFFLGSDNKWVTNDQGYTVEESGHEREGGALEKIIKPLMASAIDAIVEGVSAWWKDSSPITKAMVIGAAGLFALGGPVAGALVSGISGLFGVGNLAKIGPILLRFTKAIPLLGTAITAGMGIFDDEYKEAGYGVVDRAGLGIAEGGLDLLDFGANTTNKGVNWLTNSLFGKEFFDTDIDTSGGFKDWVNSDQGKKWLQFGSDNESSTSTQPKTPSQTVPKMDPNEIRSEMIDPDDPDPLLAREARDQRARFADSIPSSQESAKQELSRLNNNNSQLLAVLQETRDINKKTLRAIENIGTV